MKISLIICFLIIESNIFVTNVFSKPFARSNVNIESEAELSARLNSTSNKELETKEVKVQCNGIPQKLKKQSRFEKPLRVFLI